jgi:hypothetical protein
MSTITVEFGSGAAPLAPHGTDGPSLAQALRDIADDLATLKAAAGNTLASGSGVVEGLMAVDPSAPSTQASGVGSTVWNAGNIEKGWVEVSGVLEDFAAQANFNIHTGSFLTGLVDTFSCKAAIVCKNEHGTVTMIAVKGAPALTANVVAPTDAEIGTAVGAGHTWCKIMECTLNRTGDTAVTESRDLTKRTRSGGLGGLGTGTLLSVKG